MKTTYYEVQGYIDDLIGWQCLPDGRRNTLQEALDRRDHSSIRNPRLRIVRIVVTSSETVVVEAQEKGK